MKASVYKSYGELPLFLNAKMVAQVQCVSPSSTYEILHQLPNEIFLLHLPPSAFLVYAYLLLIEDRQSHTCHPSYNTITSATGSPRTLR